MSYVNELISCSDNQYLETSFVYRGSCLTEFNAAVLAVIAYRYLGTGTSERTSNCDFGKEHLLCFFIESMNKNEKFS